MARRPVRQPIEDTIETRSHDLYRLLLEYDRDEEGNFRESVHKFFKRVLLETAI